MNELSLSKPSWKESHGRFNAFLAIDLVNVLGDICVVDERQPRLEALLDKLVLFVSLREMRRVKELLLISVVVIVSLNLLKTARVGHHDHIKVA